MGIIEVLTAVDVTLRFTTFFGFIILLAIFLHFKKGDYIFDPYIVLSMFMGMATFFVYVLDILIYVIQESVLARIILHSLSYGFFSSFFYFWYRHNTAITRPQGSSWLHYPIFTLVAGIWIMIIYYLISNFISIFPEAFILPASAIVTMVSHPGWIVGILVFSYSTWVSFSVHSHIGKRSTRLNVIVSVIILVVVITSEISNILVTFGYITGEVAYLQLVIGLLIFVIALFLMVFNYLSNDDHHFYLPYTVSGILIYAQSGVAVYSKQFRINGEVNRKLELISSLFSVISALLQESLGTEAKLNTISLSGFEILFLPLKDDGPTLAVIATSSNYFLVQGMLRFKDLVPSELSDELDGKVVEYTPDFNKKITEILNKSMPFIVFD